MTNSKGTLMTRMVSTSGDLVLNIAASRCETENGPADNRRDLQIRCPQSPQPESTDVRYHPQTHSDPPHCSAVDMDWLDLDLSILVQWVLTQMLLIQFL